MFTSLFIRSLKGEQKRETDLIQMSNNWDFRDDNEHFVDVDFMNFNTKFFNRDVIMFNVNVIL